MGILRITKGNSGKIPGLNYLSVSTIRTAAGRCVGTLQGAEGRLGSDLGTGDTGLRELYLVRDDRMGGN